MVSIVFYLVYNYLEFNLFHFFLTKFIFEDARQKCVQLEKKRKREQRRMPEFRGNRQVKRVVSILFSGFYLFFVVSISFSGFNL